MQRSSQRICLVTFGLLLLVVSAACQPRAQEAAPPPPDDDAEMGAAIDALIGVWNSRDYAALDGILAADYIRRAPDQSTEGRDAMKAFMEQVHATYPDFRITVDERACAEDICFVAWTVTGTYSAEGAEPAPISVSGATLARFSGGLLAEEHVYYDTATLMAQTGAASVPHVTATE